jgi:hypothetical protein
MRLTWLEGALCIIEVDLRFEREILEGDRGQFSTEN